ncbi:MAG: hypothetical protein JNG88_12570 [Phycisphaerales bacterium]|nr:hypothetical protein [Phycisphaerales bacterium]
MNDRAPQRFMEREQARSPVSEAEVSRARESTSSRILTLPTDSDGTEDCGAFGWLRGTKERSVMLELRKRTGNIVAIGYGWLERVEFDPSIGITLLVPGQRILIQGRNLNAEIRPHVRLFEGITRHRVPWIQEVDAHMGLRQDGPHVVVEIIQV